MSTPRRHHHRRMPDRRGVLVVGRWEVVASASAVQRLDRWTGDVTVCWPLGNSSKAPSLRFYCSPQVPK